MPFEERIIIVTSNKYNSNDPPNSQISQWDAVKAKSTAKVTTKAIALAELKLYYKTKLQLKLMQGC